MKKTFLKLMFAITALCLVGTAWSCTDDDNDSEEQVEPEADPEAEPETETETETEPEPEEPWDPAGEDGVLKILAVGNSFSTDAVEQNLYELFHAANIDAILGNLYIGGCSLETHCANAKANTASYSYRKVVSGKLTTTANTTMLDGILDEDWDFITFQQSSPLSGMYDTYGMQDSNVDYLPYLVQYAYDNATNENMQVAFHQTWAYAEDSTHSGFANYFNNQMYMYYAIMDASQRAVEDNGIEIIIPCGTAIQNGRNSFMGDTFNRDGYHLEYNYGRYTASCTWFETFSHIDVTTTPYTPSTVTAEQREVCTHAAHFAVQNPYEVDPMEDYQ